MGFVMGLHGFFVMVLRMQIMSMGELRMMRGFFVMARMNVLCCFSMMLGRVIMMIGCLGMMVVSSIVRHRSLLTLAAFSKLAFKLLL
jgi:fucose 4-O-acetylase-like acetyltransferase